MTPRRDPGTQLPLLINPQNSTPPIDPEQLQALLETLLEGLNQWDETSNRTAPDPGEPDIHELMAEATAAYAEAGIHVQYRTQSHELRIEFLAAPTARLGYRLVQPDSSADHWELLDAEDGQLVSTALPLADRWRLRLQSSVPQDALDRVQGDAPSTATDRSGCAMATRNSMTPLPCQPLFGQGGPARSSQRPGPVWGGSA